MIIVLKTAGATATLALHEAGGKALAGDEWESGRQLSSQLLSHIEALLHAQKSTWDDLSGIVVFRGPGSFTSLRIGITVANAMAYAKAIPIVGEVDENWADKGIKRLAAKANDGQVMPHYGAPANITKPKGMS
ncbi:MAG TPA: tRNA (adenosine(37)-N6)-threonylcarbamoyltransferase complex dimerization subunit type 1 TsaB [Candidatus Polarisedimenticolaceae bacterium]|nr:tRNA (adenosine(37)-N6)-threonylcarbamoyltransferase complex dimerization subunit type 1 TsaB [Candidatus Polarisedimenticolaceae bacterium]